MDAMGMLLAVALIFGMLFPLLLLIVRDTVRRRGRWGINLRRTGCTRCGEPAPVVRAPKNFRQTMWGGWTCSKCGFELDKWGNPEPDQPFPADWSAKLGEARPDDARRPDDRLRRGGDYRE